MKSTGNPVAELTLGLVGLFAVLSVEQWAAVAIAGATVFALLPLGLLRWRTLMRNTPPPRPDEKDDQAGR